jgi:hypothetical protein
VERTAPGLLQFDGRLLVATELPEGVRQAVTGAGAGEFRLYAAPDGRQYVLAVQETIPSAIRPYAEVRPEIAVKLRAEKPKRAVEEYADKLRSLSEVTVYLGG